MEIADPARTVEVPGLRHATACQDPRVREHIRLALAG
jgi:hypothetical protein